MARININDELIGDYRFRRLVRVIGNEDMAIGMVYRFWRIAQLYWGKEKSLMPKEEFILEGFTPILEAGLAIEKDNYIYALGSEQNFNWYLHICRVNRKRVQSDVQTDPQCVPHSDVHPVTQSDVQTDPPLSLSLSLDNINKPTFDFERLYKLYPRRGPGKKIGIDRCKSQIKTPEKYEELEQAIHNYIAETKREKTEKKFMKHFSTFMRCWTDYLEPETEVLKHAIVLDLNS